MSDYYLRSLSIELGPEEEQIHSPKDFFSFLNKANTTLARKIFSRSKETEEINAQIKLIRKVFSDSGNFISTRYNTLTKKFEVINDSLLLIDRSLVMAKIAILAHEIISLQYLCTHLLKSIQLLGDIYVNNPKHFSKIFYVLDQLCALIQENVLSTKKAFQIIQEGNDSNMQIEEKELFPHQIKDLLESIFGEIKDLGEQVKECRQMALKSINPNTIQSVNYEMLEIAMTLSKMYFESSCDPISDASTTKKPTSSYPGQKNEEPIIEEPITEVPHIKEQDENMDSLLLKIRERILDIQKNELFHSKNYFNIYDALALMKNKTMILINEDSKDLKRLDKANNTLELTTSLLKETLAFLTKSTTERQAGTGHFFSKIHNKLNNEQNASFIDRHHNPASNFVYTHLCSYGIFRTETRKKLAAFEEACLKASYN